MLAPTAAVAKGFPALRSSLDMVMFHAFRGRDLAAEAQITLAARSIAAHYPEAAIVLLSNPAAAEARLPPSVRVEIRDVDLDLLMFERIRAYADYVRQAAAGTKIAFLDTDMLFVRRIDEMLADGADLAVTVRRMETTAINGGVVIADTSRHREVSDFFDRFVQAYAALSDDEKRWDGDQLVLAKLLRAPPAAMHRLMVEDRGGLQVRFGPVRVFNNTPRPWLLRLRLFRPGARLLHFKGTRKAYMPAYARRFLSPLYMAYVRRSAGRSVPQA